MFSSTLVLSTLLGIWVVLLLSTRFNTLINLSRQSLLGGGGGAPIPEYERGGVRWYRVEKGYLLDRVLLVVNVDTVSHIVRMLDEEENARAKDLLRGYLKTR